MDQEDDHFAIEDYRSDQRLVRCYACGAEVYEDADNCPRCGEYFEGGAWYACRKRGMKLGFVWPIAAIGVVLAFAWYVWIWFL